MRDNKQRTASGLIAVWRRRRRGLRGKDARPEKVAGRRDQNILRAGTLGSESAVVPPTFEELLVAMRSSKRQADRRDQR
jgi:hypothetical protein